MADLIQRNQIWKSREPHGRELRVITIAEGWVMVRHKGAGPFLLTERELRTTFMRGAVPQPAEPK